MTDPSKPENNLDFLHDEGYARPFDTRRLDHGTMIFTGGRKRESLDGTWTFTLDRFDTGLRQHWYRPNPLPADERTIPWDYDVEGGEAITVPSVWNLLKPEYHFYEGGAWYARDVEVHPGAPGERVFLRFGAVNYDAKVFLDGVFLGNHVGGSTPFFVEVTGKLKPSSHLLVYVNNDRTLDRVPMRHFDWFNYGGLYREVEIIRTPQVFIRDLVIDLVPDGRFDKIRLRADLSETDATGDVRFEIPALGIAVSIPVVSGIAEATIAARPELWSPDRPTLYDVTASWQGDRVADRVGFRQISVDGTSIQLNGKDVFLRGVCCHEDDDALGKVSTEADVRRRFAHVKELNGNFIRLTHYPHHEMVAQIADEVGILLWEEIPVYWAIDFANAVTYADAENQLLELIRRDRNRASVIIWGVGNENADTDARLAFMSGLAAAARSVDDTRLVSAACLVNHVKKRIEDRLVPHLDVIGLNEYFGWYEPDIQDLVAIGRNSAPTKPVVITETGADAMLGFRTNSGNPPLHSEDHVARYYRNQVEVIDTLDYVKGMSVWLLYDFRAERRKNRFQKGYNIKGLIGADKATKKLPFEVLAEYYWKRAERG